MPRLFIAEKQSVADAIAEALGVTQRKSDYYVCGADLVAAASGHLFEMPEPEYYVPACKIWSFVHLPILPREWAILPKPKWLRRIELIAQLSRQVDQLVHAGDPDNEGQLLVDQIIDNCNYRGDVLRYWAKAVDPSSVATALQNLRDNREFVGMRDAALGRSKADWLIGKNASRAFTLRSQAYGNSGAVPVGRVMTPTLAMVVKRDTEFANFRPAPYHFVTVAAHHENGTFRMRWQPREDHPGLDADGRLVDATAANEMVARLAGAQGVITEHSIVQRAEHQPRGLSLAGIGLLASEMFGYTAADTLAICQALYDTHKLASYPRVDCEYLPEIQHAEAPAILEAIRENLPGIGSWVEAADPAVKSKTWNDEEVTAHHAIIPTAMRADLSRLHEAEVNIYQLIVRSYIAQFFPVHRFDEITVKAEALGESFGARGKVVTEPGWKQLYQAPADDADDSQDLPVMTEADNIACNDAKRHDKRTTAPKRFTEGTLPIAMENIYRYEQDPDDRKALQDGDGIGTPATRGATIEKLKKIGFLTNDGKWLVSTEQGRAALNMVPPVVRSASLTALFQRQLKHVEKGTLDVEQFVQDQVKFVVDLIDLAKSDLPARVDCPACGAEFRRMARKDGTGHFWSCSAWRSTGCKASANDLDGEPDFSDARKKSSTTTAE
jgi:DNA topoisomerase-3